ncbi:MAG: glucose 1-dehydrogenase [Bacteroidetes bacterium]|nr:glucose 1-dehydrogenase [Bacteroidota bacterium]
MTDFETPFRLARKVAIVTGASKGIGQSIAELFGHAGAKVIVSSRKQAAIDNVAEKIISNGHQALSVACNMGDKGEIKNLIEKTIEYYGRIDVIVNNAAANPVYGPVEDTEDWAFDKIMNVNVKGPLELCKLALPHMKKKGGSIVNISSIGGITPEPGIGIYSVSKAALISLTKVMAREWGHRKIRANVICPGLIKTKFSEALWSNDKVVKKMLGGLPIPRIGHPEDVAALALYLASDASAYTTGGVHMADGGYLA